MMQLELYDITFFVRHLKVTGTRLAHAIAWSMNIIINTPRYVILRVCGETQEVLHCACVHMYLPLRTSICVPIAESCAGVKLPWAT